MTISRNQELIREYSQLLNDETAYFASNNGAKYIIELIIYSLKQFPLHESHLDILQTYLTDLTLLISAIKRQDIKRYPILLDTYNTNARNLNMIVINGTPLYPIVFDKYISFIQTLQPKFKPMSSAIKMSRTGYATIKSPPKEDKKIQRFELDITAEIKALQQKFKYLNPQQQKDLAALCEELQNKAQKLNKATISRKEFAKESEKIIKCIDQTIKIIDQYKQCQTDISQAINPGRGITLDLKLTEVKTVSDNFITNVKAYEKECAKWNLGQKIFIGACTLVGGLLGAVLGAAAGLAAGAAIGGGVGSVVPLFGNIAGAVVAGNVGAIVGIIKGIGLGAAIGTAAATAIMGAGVGYGAKKGAGSSLFMTKQQKFVTGLKRDMEKEVKSDAKDAQALLKLNKKYNKLDAEKKELNGKPGVFFKETRVNRKEAKMRKIRSEYLELETKINNKGRTK